MELAVGNIQLAQLNQAFNATRQARLNCSYNNSLWRLAHTWSHEQHKVLKAYHQGTYQLSPQTTYAIKDELISQFDAKDAVIFRAIATQIKTQLSAKFSNAIMHLKGHGSIKGVLRHISALLPQFNYFYKTDVGLIQKGFNFLGYRITREGLSLSRLSLSRLRERIRQLTEQTKCQTRLAEHLKGSYLWIKDGLRSQVLPHLLVNIFSLRKFLWKDEAFARSRERKYG